ncbi:hypothetical protein [Deinococcus marmoris]|uniref:hypothetical protein n=1 Tax=Deinococcus marmoris TaxID=249408 RepID=UPI0012DF27DF|nr:hypothetical protein [Deinococcus marmoris]
MQIPDISGLFNPLIEEAIKSAAKSVLGGIASSAKSNIDNRDFLKKARAEYIRYIRSEIGLIQIFGIKDPVALEEMYVTTKFYKSEESFAKYVDTDNARLRYGRRATFRHSEAVSIPSIIQASTNHGVII